MNNEILKHEEFGSIRVHYLDGEPWFVAKDLCDALGINNSRQATSILDESETGVISNDVRSENGIVQKREMTIVNESGMYQLIFRSRKPKAQKFVQWVTSEIMRNDEAENLTGAIRAIIREEVKKEVAVADASMEEKSCACQKGHQIHIERLIDQFSVTVPAFDEKTGLNVPLEQLDALQSRVVECLMRAVEHFLTKHKDGDKAVGHRGNNQEE